MFHCAACSVEFLFPQPSDQQLGKIYSTNYFIGAGDAAALKRAANLKRSTAAMYLDAIRPLLKGSHPRLLEIGCGHGDFLLEAQTRGCEVQGLEYSADAVATANQRLGSNAVLTGSLETCEFPVDQFDGIVGFDVIEHVRDPIYAVQCLQRTLKPGGLIAFATPSLDSWSRRLLGRYWMEYKTEHLTYFNRRSLTRLLNENGFERVRFLPNFKMLSFDYICEHFFRYPVPVITPFLRFLRRLTPNAVAYRPVKVIASGTMVLAQKPS